MIKIEIPFLPWWQVENHNFDAVLFDIDGTLMNGRSAMPGAIETIEWLRTQRFPFFLLTNDGNHSTQEKSTFLQNAGLPIVSTEIVSCCLALHYLVAHRQLENELFFVMGDLGDPNYAEEAGLQITRNLEQLDACHGIIVGEGFYDWQKTITAVVNSLRLHPEKPLIVPNPDSYWPSGKNGQVGIGAGAKSRFICMLLEEMGKTISPIYLGKPHSLIYQYTLDRLKERFSINRDLDHRRVIMLGDSLKSDILGANTLSMTSALLMTGITEADHIKKSGDLESPDFIFSSLI